MIESWRTVLSIFSMALFSGCFFGPMDRVESKGMAIVAGYHGFDEHYVEVGGAYHIIGSATMAHLPGPVVATYSVTAKLKLTDTFVPGIEASIWKSGFGSGVGISATYYTDFSQSSFHVRPEVGIGDVFLGPVSIRFIAGYSIPLTIGSLSGREHWSFALRGIYLLY